MTYKLDVTFIGNPLLPWIYVFSFLSIKQSRRVYDMLDFPFNPPSNLQQIAHDFSLTWLTMMTGSDYDGVREILHNNGEAVSVDLLIGTSSNDPFTKRRDALFTNTFVYLESMGYAEAIYHWGKQTTSYYTHKYRDGQKLADWDVLGSWCQLLKLWALEPLKYPILPQQPSHSNDSESVVAPTYDKPTFTFSTMPLSDTLQNVLRAIILHCELRKTLLEAITNDIMVSPKSIWEDVALRTGGATLFIRQDGRFRIDIREWHMIENSLSLDEMNILEQWALQNKDHDPYFQRTLSIPSQEFKSFISNVSE